MTNHHVLPTPDAYHCRDNGVPSHPPFRLLICPCVQRRLVSGSQTWRRGIGNVFRSRHLPLGDCSCAIHCHGVTLVGFTAHYRTFPRSNVPTEFREREKRAVPPCHPSLLGGSMGPWKTRPSRGAPSVRRQLPMVMMPVPPKEFLSTLIRRALCVARARTTKGEGSDGSPLWSSGC